MTYRFKLQEPIGQGVRRVGLEQIEIAAAKLADKGDISTAIHDARRCLKRLRALLRLIEPGLAEGLYRREAARLAGIGRLLAGARDLHVMQQTLGKLTRRFDALPAGATERLAKFAAHSQGHGRRTGVDGRQQALLRRTLPTGGPEQPGVADPSGRGAPGRGRNPKRYRDLVCFAPESWVRLPNHEPPKPAR